jgi:hypothetical protein
VFHLELAAEHARESYFAREAKMKVSFIFCNFGQNILLFLPGLIGC